METLPAELVKSLRSLGLEGRISTPEQAVTLVRSGDHVFLGTASATPRVLTAALEERADLDDVHLFHFLTDGAIPVRNGLPRTRFYHRAFFVGSETREAIKQGKADYVPICLAQVPSLIENKRIPVDVAMIQVSMPEEHGYVSLGVSVDITRSAVQNAHTVIAEVNPNMPITYGDTFIPLERLDRIVPVDAPVIEYIHSPADALAERIARYVARIVEDGATLQVGLGRIPNEMLKYLTERRDLGIHSDVITDSIVDLIEKGVVTGKAKSMHRGRVVASYCMGTERLYRLIHRNPTFEFYPIDYVCNQAVIAGNRNFVSVTQAFAVDLTGQICADQYEGEFYSGVSTQPDFLRGAAQAPGGKPIICLLSTTEDERQSRIRPLLLEGEGVTIPRSDVHYVVTEYGSVYLFGKSIRDRALALIQISHPKFRSQLLEEAKRLGYVRPDQTLRSRLPYPAEEERIVVLKNGVQVLLRPSRASDVEALQDVFYHLTEEDVLTRFFASLRSLPVSQAEHLCNVDYETEMAFVAVVGGAEREAVVGSSCYHINPTTNLAEIAFMIRPEWQSLGLGSILQQRMTEYAKSKGLRGFTAEILARNIKMRKLAQRAENVSMKVEDGVCEVTILF